MGYSRFWLKAADEESKSIPHVFPSSHWLKATGQCVLERYLSATMFIILVISYFGFESETLVLIASVPGHCLHQFTLNIWVEYGDA